MLSQSSNRKYSRLIICLDSSNWKNWQNQWVLSTEGPDSKRNCNQNRHTHSVKMLSVRHPKIVQVVQKELRNAIESTVECFVSLLLFSRRVHSEHLECHGSMLTGIYKTWKQGLLKIYLLRQDPQDSYKR